MLGIYKGCPAIYCPDTGECVVTFQNNARGWQEAAAIVRDVREQLALMPAATPGKS